MKILFMILNMNKSIDRMNNMDNIFKKLGENYIRIESVDGKNIDKDKICKKIYKKDLIGKILHSYESKQKWKYDGTIKNSFPGMNLNGHHGYKGLTLSNMKAFYESKKYNFDWLIILEDDIYLTKKELLQIKSHLLINNNDVVLLDERGNGYGGACGVAYRKKVIDKMINEFDPLSEFSINYEKNFNKAALNDWKLYDILNHFKIPYNSYPIIRSGYYDSTISDNVKKRDINDDKNINENNIIKKIKNKVFNCINNLY